MPTFADGWGAVMPQAVYNPRLCDRTSTDLPVRTDPSRPIPHH
ncbi:hypothetical protein [Leptolyngbya ectocarpi]|nr:hypothetical protein [Leptolyngbya ectocarpi]